MTAIRTMKQYIDPRVIERDRRAYMEAIQPLIRRKAAVYNYVSSRIIIKKDGSLESEFLLTETQQKLLDLIDQLIMSAMPRTLKDNTREGA